MKQTVIALLILLALATLVDAQTVSNIRAELEPSCGYYIITYDLKDKVGDNFLIQLVPYMNTIEIVNPKYAKGQGIDSSTPSGNDLRIYWNPIFDGGEAGNWQFRINALAIPSNMVIVDGGTFLMGSEEGDNDERPVHQVTISSFLIGKYEVTQEEWRDVMGTNPSYFKYDKLPVNIVNWYDAISYCNNRSIKEGFNPCYSGSGKSTTCNWSANGYRLPTEAEWEFAARGGNKKKAIYIADQTM